MLRQKLKEPGLLRQGLNKLTSQTKAAQTEPKRALQDCQKLLGLRLFKKIKGLHKERFTKLRIKDDSDREINIINDCPKTSGA
jgi:hypothetical protein